MPSKNHYTTVSTFPFVKKWEGDLIFQRKSGFKWFFFFQSAWIGEVLEMEHITLERKRKGVFTGYIFQWFLEFRLFPGSRPAKMATFSQKMVCYLSLPISSLKKIYAIYICFAERRYNICFRTKLHLHVRGSTPMITESII